MVFHSISKTGSRKSVNKQNEILVNPGVIQFIVDSTGSIDDNESMKEIIIITGAGSGLGREFALQLSASIPADEIWLLARNREKLRQTAELAEKNVKHDGAVKARIFPGDIAGKSGVAAFSELLEEEAKTAGGLRIKVLVNNAGFGTYGPVMETETDDQLNMIELNALTPAGFCMAGVPYMEAGSVIINTASLAAFAPLGNFAVYAATKAFLHSFSTALGAELADKGIKVCSVCPGPVSTNFAAVASKGARKEVKGGADASRTAAHAIRCALAGKPKALMLFKWKLKAFLSRFIPRYAFARWTFKHEKRPRAKENGINPAE